MNEMESISDLIAKMSDWLDILAIKSEIDSNSFIQYSSIIIITTSKKKSNLKPKFKTISR